MPHSHNESMIGSEYNIVPISWTSVYVRVLLNILYCTFHSVIDHFHVTYKLFKTYVCHTVHSEGYSCNHANSLSSTPNSLKITQDLAVINANRAGWLAAKWAACGWKCGWPSNWFGLRNSRSSAAIFSLSHSGVSFQPRPARLALEWSTTNVFSC